MPTDFEQPTIEPPEWDYWLSREEWALKDGALILQRVEPRSDSGRRIRNALAIREVESRSDLMRRALARSVGVSDPEMPFFEKALETLTNAGAASQRMRLLVRDGKVVPRAFLLWARERKYDMPPGLRELIQGDSPPEAPASIASSPGPQRKNARNPRREEETRALKAMFRERPDSFDRATKKLAAALRNMGIDVKPEGFPDVVRRAKKQSTHKMRRAEEQNTRKPNLQ